MRYRLIVLLFAAFFCLPASAIPKYFGYFANNSHQPGNQDHTNVTVVYTGPDGYDWDPVILSEVALAKSYGNKAIVMVTSHLFVAASGNGPHSADPEATRQFGDLVGKLIAGGYLVPNNPEASTVVAFYPVDEPEYKKGLVDINGAAHPALANAVNVIKSNPATSNFPVAGIVSQDYGPVVLGMRLFDWIGMDDYKSCMPVMAHCSRSYATSHANFTAALRPEQRTIVVPQAATGGDLDENPHEPFLTYQMAMSDPRVIMLMPFLWANPAMTGVRDLPELRNAYLPIGYQIKYGLYSQYLGGQVYGQMVAGQSYNLVLWFRNVSEHTWRTGTNMNLGSQSPRDNSTWGTSRVVMPHDVSPGQDVAFNFWVQAPAWAGTYQMQWKMVKDGMSWLSGATPDWSISVLPPPSGSIGANQNPCTIPWGGSTCATTLSWNSNRADAEVWVSGVDGSNPILFARGQSGSQAATWITTSVTRFTLKSGGAAITHVDVYGVQASEPPPVDPPPCHTPGWCQEP